MSRCISVRLALAALIAAAALPLSSLAQSQDSQTQSVADAARRAREQKKAADKQPAPVITNDTLKPAAPASAPSPDAAPASAPSSQPAAEGSKAPAPGAAASATADQSAPGLPAADGDQKPKDSAEVAAQKQQLAEAQKELDLLQRELALEQDNVYSKPNSASDTAGKAKLDDLTQQLAGKQQTVETLKARLEALLGSAGAAAPAKPPAPPQP
jgi:uncharacterized coiled-coil protein SlyX